MKLAFFTLLAFSASTLFAQHQDYVVKHNGDTIFGNIKLKNSSFTVTNANGSVIIAADEIKNIESSDFKGNTVLHLKLHTYTDNLSYLERGWAAASEIDTVMILTEIYDTPKMKLFRGVDKERTQYYFYKVPADSLPVQLVVRYAIGGGASASGAELYGANSRANLQVFKGYVNQLRAIIGDCRKISDKYWEELDYRDYSFKGLIKLYNKCK